MKFLTNYLLFARNWYREGAFHLRFGMYIAPASIELTAPGAREPYCSYPPGAVFPIYLLSKLRGHEPTLCLLMKYTLLTHLLVALMLSWTTFALLRQLRYARPDALILSAIPIVIELLTPAPLFQFQMRYLPDHAVIPMLVLYIFLEVLQDSVTDRRLRHALGLLQAGAAFAGILTDYLFGLVALCVYAKRFACGTLGKRPSIIALRSTIFWSPVALGILAFLLQLYLLVGGFEEVSYKSQLWGASFTSGLPLFSLKNYFWKVHMVRAYGHLGIALLWLSLLCIFASLALAGMRLFRRKPLHRSTAPATALAFMLTLPCFLHAFLLRTHSAFPLHHFSTLKFSIPLAVVPFVLVPVVIRSWFHGNPAVSVTRRVRAFLTNGEPPGFFIAPLLPTALLALACGFVYAEYPRVQLQFRREVEDGQRRALAEFVDANTTWEDVVFTWDPELTIPAASEDHVFSTKTVYQAPSLQMAYSILAYVDGEYIVDVLTRENTPPAGSNCDQLIPLAYHEVRADGLRLLKIRKQDFLALCKEAHVSASPRRKSEPQIKFHYSPINPDIVRRFGEMTVDIDETETPNGVK
jgi:hypothetical protein